ncbi:MAG TPA: extracellular solute-binding protein [Spirochaetia bacterium]|nr:extracellular solute-binding protein [Spirochaetia bacterium]
MKFKRLLVVAFVGCALLFAAQSLIAGGSKEASTSTGAAQSSGPVTITYWQYSYASKVDLVGKLIQQFNSENPGITVQQVNFPYEQYNQKVAASVPAGQGPEIVNLYYGWLPIYVKSGYIQPLPSDQFNADYFKNGYYPFVAQSSLFDGKYYSLPTAVRSLALFYNRKLMSDAGLNPDNPPKTLQDLEAYAKKMSKYDAQGNLTQAGMAMQPSGQGHVWIREVLFRQFGATPYSDDGRKVLYDSPQGVAALTWYTDLITKDKVGYPNFATDDVTAFTSQKAAMNIDGSFRIASLKKVEGLDWRIAELPTNNGIKSNFASYWTNGIVTGVSGAKLAASVKFLKFLSSPEVQKAWLTGVGELPATPSLSAAYESDPNVSTFLKGLAYAHATKYVDEAGQRDIMDNAVDAVVQGQMTPAQALHDAAVKEQKLIDNFWK